MADELGAAKGLIGGMRFPSNGLMGGDSTLIPASIRAIMAKRKAASTDTTPKVNVLEDIKAANEGKRVAPIPDSTIKKSHDEWLKHIDDLGYEVKKKQ
jgi:hypothetical protein